jgi:predicted RNA-binding protein associated with RNAse of E/G family
MGSDVRRFAPGASIVWRSVDRDKRLVQTVWPWTVVRDEENGIVLFMPSGTVGKQRTGTRGGPRDRMLLHWDGGHRDVAWHSTNVVRLYREGEEYSIWVARDDATGAVLWRYINLEAPWLRTPIGFDSRDHYLDLYAEREEDEWHWKDEDEVAWLIEQGHIDRAFADATRRAGERAIAHVKSRQSLFDPSWMRWRPDPAWRIPELPSDWREYEPRAR